MQSQVGAVRTDTLCPEPEPEPSGRFTWNRNWGRNALPDPGPEPSKVFTAPHHWLLGISMQILVQRHFINSSGTLAANIIFASRSGMPKLAKKSRAGYTKFPRSLNAAYMLTNLFSVKHAFVNKFSPAQLAQIILACNRVGLVKVIRNLIVIPVLTKSPEVPRRALWLQKFKLYAKMRNKDYDIAFESLLWTWQ